MNYGVKYKKNNDKVMIIGLSYNRQNVPFDDKSFDFWSLNHGCEIFGDKLDLCFDMHNWQTSEYKVSYYETLCKKDIGCPLVVPDINLSIKSSQIEYPYDAIEKLAGRNFRNSIPEMIMYAYYIGYIYIYLIGIDNKEFDEYPDMGHSLYYSIGFVRAKECKVYILNDYHMDDSYFYGYQIMKTKDAR